MINRFLIRKGLKEKGTKLTLKDFALLGHSYWRFSQSEERRSVEGYYAEYKPGVITYAADKDKFLSFVNDITIASCFMYGDMLTKLVFDVNNEEFKKIQSCKVKVIGGMLGEYESKKLLPEINYPLSDLTTIRLIFSMVQNNRQLCTIFYNRFGDLECRLRKFGFTESAEMVHYLKEEFEKDIHLSKDKMMHLIDQYIYEIKLEKE